MRTTLTLDDDVAAGLRQIQKRRKLSFKAAVNQILREGLTRNEKPSGTRPRFNTPVHDVGPILMNIDNVAEVLDLIEGDWHK